MAHPLRSPTDGFPTPTSILQSTTEETLAGIPSSNTPTLQKKDHIQFLLRNLVQGFPSRYMSQDASQPWLMFWTVQGFSVFQVGLDPKNKQRVIDTIMASQHPEGGFSGGPGQSPHLLPTYAAICTLAIVGRPGPGGGWDQIDREKMYNFFISLKQPDGSFLVTHHAEVDVRGIYCLIAVAYLLNILRPALVENTADFIASCQTYEGGFSSASQPYFSSSSTTLLNEPRPPLGEAHGGYTFCALASWVMLQAYIPPSPSLNQRVNYKNLLRWLTQMQGTEIELGGFKGRTNKLVDGCYSWWVGGCFAFLEALGVGVSRDVPEGIGKGEEKDDEGEWDEVDDGLYNRKALQEYILYAGQDPAGGLRDKPPKLSDAYHTLYCTSGLSAAQHRVLPSPARRAQLLSAWNARSQPHSVEDRELEMKKLAFLEALSWTQDVGGSKYVGGVGKNIVNATHPLFNLTITHTEAIMGYFYGVDVPRRTIISKA